jgi:hypothetical protein
MREAVRPWVPSHVFNSPKQGFGPWLHTWYREELCKLTQRLVDVQDPTGVLSMPIVGRMANMRTDDPKHFTALWQMLVLHSWLTRSGVSP